MRTGRGVLRALFVVALLMICGDAGAQTPTSLNGLMPPASTPGARRKEQEQWLRRGRTIPGDSGAALRYRAYQQIQQTSITKPLKQVANSVPHATAPVGWTPLGPGPLASDASGTGAQDYSWVSGRATAVTIDPNDTSGNTIYVGGAFGGLWRSSNAGPLCPDPSTVTWNVPVAQNPHACLGSANSSPASLLDDQPTLSVGAIAIQPQLSNADPATSLVLVGTGETNSSSDSYYGLGILRSPDAGNTWTLIRQDASGTHKFAGIGFSQIAFDTATPTLVVAAAEGTSQGELDGLQNPLTANLGLYYSTNSGQAWNFATVMDGPSTVAPSSTTAVVYDAAATEFFAAIRFHGFYKSADGIHWTRLIQQPGNGLLNLSCPPSPTLQTCPIYRGEIAVVPNRAGANGLGEVYVWYTDGNDVDQGIWKTVDSGATWSAIDDQGITNCGDVLGGCGTQDAAYNLTLAAVPDNLNPNATAGTDLYAGAVNIYKCLSISTISDCSGATPNTFLNLTHAYGCPPDFGSIAKVHPSQHSIDFMQINGGSQVVMYFANDGGIYRTLDGYSGLISGGCGTSNQFDSLNQTLGSMTQFVSIAQHPIDPNTIFGGTQGNGSPATAASQTSPSWITVNSGDGGYSEINPDNPLEWFTANTGVTIQSCNMGISCHSSDFNAKLIVSSSTLGGDGGPLYTPYLLDPKNSSEMIVGTCRVWRGTTQGSGFVALSQNFDSLSATSCTGSEVNTLRSLAAGGSVDANGFSSVIYAGTDGTGPIATSADGGHVWVMATDMDGSTVWTDITGTINPGNFPISAIVVDPSDASGDTAYVTIMGFHVTHIWQTKNAGQTWNDFTGTSLPLPDAPANAVVIDSGRVYVGTDIGVFSSSTATANWTRVGQAPVSNSTLTGFLPNVPVTALRIFNNQTTKLLRAATYGRGVWQFPLVSAPDFDFSFNQSTQASFAGQNADFSGILDAFDGFSSNVTMTCADAAPNGSVPNICSVAANPLAPSAPTMAFTLSAGGTIGDYNFSVVGTGGGISRAAPLTLHVIDFTLGSPSPSAVSLNSGSTSTSVTMPVGFLGSFPAGGMVTLSCAAAAGLTCNFFPSNSILASEGINATLTVTLSASTGTPAGTTTVSIDATSTDAGQKTVIQPLSVTVTRAPDFSLAVNSPTSPAVGVGQTISLSGNVIGLNGYANTVQLSCATASTTPPATCAFNPAALNSSAEGTAFTLAAMSKAPGSYSFNVQGVGGDASSITHTEPLTLTFFDLAIAANPLSQTVSAGQNAVYSLTLTPEGLSTFQQAVTYSCGSLPALTSCSFNPSQIPGGNSATQVTLTVSTTATVADLHVPGDEHLALLFAFLLPVAGLLLKRPASRKHTVTRRASAMIGMLFILTLFQSSCGGGLTGGSGNSTSAQPGTMVGTYPIAVTATEGAGAQALQPPALQLSLTVQ